VRLAGLGKLKNFNGPIGTGTRDLPASNIAPQRSTISDLCLLSVGDGIKLRLG
jgi:hypothetical protein